MERSGYFTPIQGIILTAVAATYLVACCFCYHNLFVTNFQYGLAPLLVVSFLLTTGIPACIGFLLRRRWGAIYGCLYGLLVFLIAFSWVFMLMVMYL